MAFPRLSATASLYMALAVVVAATGCPALNFPHPGGSGAVVSPSENPEIRARRQYQHAAPMIVPRMAFAYTTFKGRIYVFGGLTGPAWDTATDSIEVYDPLSDTWARDGKLPWPLSFAAAGVIGDRIYLAGGQVVKETGCPPEDEALILRYDPARHVPEEAGSLPEPRWGLALLPFEGGLLAVGGFQRPFAMQFSKLFQPRFSRTDCPATGTGTGQSAIVAFSSYIKPDAAATDGIPLAQARGLAGFGTLGGIPFLTQGWVRGADHPTLDNRSTSLDRSNGRWLDSTPPMLDTSWGPASAQAGPDAFVVAGGLHPGYPADSGVQAGRQDVRFISRGGAGALSGDVRNLPALPDGRGLGGAAVIAEKLYIFGGLGGGAGREVVSNAMYVLRDMSPEPPSGVPGRSDTAPSASLPTTTQPAPTPADTFR